MKIVILAGGVGTRLWPRSRQSRPKQFLSLVGERTMLQDTFDRVRPLIAPDDIFVMTGRPYLRGVWSQLPDLPRVNVLGEPAGRGSAPAIGLAATYLDGHGDDVVAFLPADHVVERPDEFRQALVAAEAVARQGYLVTLGIRPTLPFTGYGYIQRGEELATAAGMAAYKVARFAEKPDKSTAERYLDEGTYSWNAGMFVGRVSTFLEELAAYMPSLAGQLAMIHAALGTSKEHAVLNALWPQVQPATIDYGIMEKTARAAVIPVDIGWSDVGDWASLAGVLGADGQGNVVRGQHVGIDTRDCLVQGSGRRLIATIGLQDMVVVDAGDAILVCPKSRCQEARQLVERIRSDGRVGYL